MASLMVGKGLVVSSHLGRSNGAEVSLITSSEQRSKAVVFPSFILIPLILAR